MSTASYAIAKLFPEARLYKVFPRSGLIPAWAVVAHQQQTLLFSYGASTTSQLISLAASATRPMGQGSVWAAMDVVIQLARSVRDHLRLFLDTTKQNWTLIGHSLGGAIMEVLVAVLGDTNERLSASVLTFGSPRVGDARLAALLSGFPVYRVFSDNDPVPLVPPRLFDAPLAAVNAGFLAAYLWSLYEQPPGGLQIDAQGRVYPWETPTLAPLIAEPTLTGWLTTAMLSNQSGHSLVEYGRRLSAAYSSGRRSLRDMLGVSGPESDRPLTQEAFDEVSKRKPVSPNTNEGGSSMAYIPPTYRATVLRISTDLWGVFWMAHLIAQNNNRSHCRTMAARLNAFLRKMQDQDMVFQSELTGAINEYLPLATDTANGFKPPLNLSP
jgi:pimeloyl-ACP methyl ester carboxylesterase